MQHNEVKYVLVNIFADEGLTRLAKMLFVGCRLNVPLKIIGREWEDGEWPDEKRVIPLILCEKKESLRKHGVKVPREFVLERRDLLSVYDIRSAKYSSPFARLRDRLACIEKWMDQNRATRGWARGMVSKSEFAFWFEGMFRGYCFQDEDVHGASGLLKLPRIGEGQKELIRCSYGELIKKRSFNDLRDKFLSGFPKEFPSTEFNDGSLIRAPWDDWFEDKRLTQRFCIGSDIGSLDFSDVQAGNLHFLKGCFKEEFGLIRSAIKAFLEEQRNWSSTEEKKEKWAQMCCVFAVALKRLSNNPYSGEPIRYLSLTRKLSVLVLDDNANLEVELLAANDRLNSVFSFDALQVVAKVHDDFLAWVMGELKSRVTLRKRTYDLILLDLSLGESVGQDLSGYHLIRRLQQMFPHMPVVVYSKFDDMGHIVRALNNGARWFLKKSDVEKLPRHVLSMLRMRNWLKEWTMVCANHLCDFAFADSRTAKTNDFISQFSDERKYLTYKCLEYYPGRRIEISPMRGGYSSAVTFRAVKGPSGAQSPVIIKIDTEFNTRMEYERYNRFIRPYIANESGRVEGPAITIRRELSAIVYTFAGKQDDAHELVTLKARLSEDAKANSSCDYGKYALAFEMLLNDILPQIHCVSPEREFGDRDDDNLYKSDSAILLPWTTSFPNAAFGEKANVREASEECHQRGRKFAYTIDADSFLANYLCRMPLVLGIENPEFVSQPRLSEGGAGLGCTDYEFHDLYESDVGCAIDAYDDKKLPIRLTGATVDHVVRYRPQLYPAMTLWVKCHKVSEMSVDLEPELIAALKDVSCDVKSKHRGSLCFYWKALLRGRGMDWVDVEKCTLECSVEELRKYFVAKYNSAHQVLQSNPERFYCPVGIIHGDMNFANIMVESRKDFGKRIVFSDDKPDVSDVWLIDFARTRRDLVAHDFNVLFTSAVELLFDKGVWNDEYEERMRHVFRAYIEAAIWGESDAIPDCVLSSEKRFGMVFRILRVVRMAALKTGMTEDAYILTTAFACMVSSRIFMIHSKNVYSSAAMMAISELCFDKLKI